MRAQNDIDSILRYTFYWNWICGWLHPQCITNSLLVYQSHQWVWYLCHHSCIWTADSALLCQCCGLITITVISVLVICRLKMVNSCIPSVLLTFKMNLNCIFIDIFLTILSETSVTIVASASMVCWWCADFAVCWWSAKQIPLRHSSCHHCTHQVTVQVMRDDNMMEASLGGRPEWFFTSKTRGETHVFALIFKSSPSYQMQIQPIIKRRQSALLNCRLILICNCHSTWQLIYVQHLKLQM